MMYTFSKKVEAIIALVLCTGVHHNLVETRKLILEDAGHTVITATSESAIEHACQQHTFDVAVIGQAITTNEKTRFLAIIRQRCPAVKVLELYPPYLGRTLQGADDWLQVPLDVPPDLAEHVTALAVKSSG
jgi:CheY-like chemotaxis protein